MSNDIQSLKGQVASLTRSRRSDDPELIQARQELRVAVLAQHVRRAVEALPPLTDEQVARVAALLRPSVEVGA